MDIVAVAPLAKTGVISETLNLWLAVPIGFVFGVALYHGGFTDSRKISGPFYLKDVDVPVTMFSAIATGMIGLWLMILTGFLDASKVYFLRTYLTPMAIGGLLFGIGMVVGGFCPGTAVASFATGRIDAMVFVLGFFGGSIVFGDLFPFWGPFYDSDYHGVWRLDEVFGLSLGQTVLVMVVIAIAGSMMMRMGQHYFWPDTVKPADRRKLKVPATVLSLAVSAALVLAFFPTNAFMPGEDEPGYYIVQKVRAEGPEQIATPPAPATEPAFYPPLSTPDPSAAPATTTEGT